MAAHVRLTGSVAVEDISRLLPDQGSLGGEPEADPYRLFVGRDRELEAMVRALDDAREGRGRLILLAGEPGIGKTRLAVELAFQAAEAGATVLWGSCWEAGGAPAFWPWIQALRELVRSIPEEKLRASLAGGASEIAQLLPELRQRLPDLPDLPPAPPDAARFRLFEAVQELLRNVSRERHLVIMLEDLHAADAPSILLLRFVADGVSGDRVLLAGSYREGDVQPDQPLTSELLELLRVRRALRLPLSGLGLGDVGRLVRAISGSDPPERLVKAIYEGTEGNPLFVREIVQLLSSEGRLSERADPRRWGVPEGVRQVIGRRLDRLSPEGKRTISVGSVLGKEFTLEVLGRILQQPAVEVLESLRDGLAARVIIEVAREPGRFRFSHSLVRETMYEHLGPAERVRLHRAAGESLEELYAADPEPHLAELAYHFFEAAPSGDVDKAVDYARRAGERAVAQVAYEEAVRLFQMGLLALERSPDEEIRCRLLLGLGDAQARAGDSPAAQETFRDAAVLATRVGLPELLAQAALGYGGRFTWLRAGTDPHLIPLLEQALAALGPEDGVLRARVLSRLAGALRDQASIDRRASLSAEAVAMARRIGDPDTLMQALISHWAAVSLGPDGLSEQMSVAEELNRVAEEVGDRERVMDAFWFRYIRFMTMGEVEEARREQQTFSRLAQELGQPSQQWYAGVMGTILALQDGRFTEAEELIRKTHEAGRRAQNWDAGASAMFALFALRREQGRLNELEDSRRRAIDEYPGYRGFRCMLTLSLCELGQLDDARRMFDRLARDDFAALPKDNEWLSNLTLLAEVADALGDRDRAATMYELLSPYAALVALAGSEVSMGPVQRPLGILASMLGRYDEASRHFEGSMEMCERMGARPWLARTRYHYARMLAARGAPGDRERAVELARAALRTAEATGMVALEDKLNALVADLGAGPVPDADRVSFPPAGIPSSHFRREGEYWSIVFEGDAFRLRDLKGLRYLSRLLGEPGREFHVLDLVAAERGPAPVMTLSEPGLQAPGDAGEVLDAQARAAYRERVKALEEDIEEARSFGDPDRAARAEGERDFLVRELAGAVGLGGRGRRIGSDVERARVGVTQAIRTALGRIREQSAQLGAHLDRTVRTGTFCSYVPDPRAPVEWRT
jgi:tetratricopeptide (TPR) repeat protein